MTRALSTALGAERRGTEAPPPGNMVLGRSGAGVSTSSSEGARGDATALGIAVEESDKVLRSGETTWALPPLWSLLEALHGNGSDDALELILVPASTV